MAKLHGNVKSMELEAKSMIEKAWYDCIVSISLKNLTLEVQSVEPEFPATEYLSSQEVALAQLRARSEPLLGEGCLEVKEGQVVLSQLTVDSGRNLLYDGKVEKVRRLRHASGAICKCSFEIRWLEGLRKGEKATVRAEVVRRLVNSDISTHPVIAEWLKLLESEKCTFSNETHSKTSLVDSDIEGDIQTRLEQQVEQIAQSVDVDSRNIRNQETATQKKKDSRQTRHGHNRVHSLTPDMDQAAELVSLDSIPSSLSEHNKGVSNGTAIKEDIHAREQTLTSIPRDEKRPRLSPLAARAALAASMQEPSGLSHKENIKVRDNFGKLITYESDASNASYGVLAMPDLILDRKNVSQTYDVVSTTTAADSKDGVKIMTSTRLRLSSRKKSGQLTHRTVTRASTNVSHARYSPRKKKEALDPPKLADPDLKIMLSSPNSPGKSTSALHLGEKILLGSSEQASGNSNHMAEMQAEIEFAVTNSEKQFSAASGKPLGDHRRAHVSPDHKVGRKSPRLALKNGLDKVHITEPKTSKLSQKAMMLKSPVVEIKSQPEGTSNAWTKVSSARRSSRPSFNSTTQTLLQYEDNSLQVKTFQFESLNPPLESNMFLSKSIRSTRDQNAVQGLGLQYVRNGESSLSTDISEVKRIVSMTSKPFNMTISSVMHERSQPRRSSRFTGKSSAENLFVIDSNKLKNMNSADKKHEVEDSQGRIQTIDLPVRVKRTRKTKAPTFEMNMEKRFGEVNLGPDIFDVLSVNQSSSRSKEKHAKLPSADFPRKIDPSKYFLTELPREEHITQQPPFLRGNSSTERSLEMVAVCNKDVLVGSRKPERNPKIQRVTQNNENPSKWSSSKPKRSLIHARKQSTTFAVRKSRRLKG